MLLPKTERIGQAICFTWPDYHLRITLDRFKDSSRGLFAELEASYQQQGKLQPITSFDINLKSSRTRSEVAKQLEKRYPKLGEDVWRDIAEYLCVFGVKQYRAGEPAVEVSDDFEAKAVPYVLSPLVYQGLPTVVFADGGTGKSYLGILSAILIERGGWYGPFAGVPGRALYLDWETTVEEFTYRKAQLVRGCPELAGTKPLYRRCFHPLDSDIASLCRLVQQEGITLVIIDSLAMAAGGDLASPDAPIRFFGALRALNISSLVLAHVSKNAETKSIYGSVFFKNLARTTWEMSALTDADDRNLVGLYQRKTNLSALHRAIGLEYVFQPETLVIREAQLDDAQAVLPASQTDQVKRALVSFGGEALTADAIAEATGLNAKVVGVILSRGEGKWCQRSGKDGRSTLWAPLMESST